MNVHLKQETNKHQILEPFNEGPFLYLSRGLSDFMNLGTRVVCLNNNLDYYVETLVTLTTGNMTSETNIYPLTLPLNLALQRQR